MSATKNSNAEFYYVKKLCERKKKITLWIHNFKRKTQNLNEKHIDFIFKIKTDFEQHDNHTHLIKYTIKIESAHKCRIAKLSQL